MSPEARPTPALDPTLTDPRNVIAQELMSDPGMIIDAERLQRGTTSVIGTETFAETQEDGVDQRLVAVLQAGSEAYGVIKSQRPNQADASQMDTLMTVVSFGRGVNDRARLIGIVAPNKSFTMLENKAATPASEASAADRHFTLELNEANQLTVSDSGSKSGTFIFDAQPDYNPAEQGGVLASGRWSVKGSDANGLMGAALAKNEGFVTQEAAPSQDTEVIENTLPNPEHQQREIVAEEIGETALEHMPVEAEVQLPELNLDEIFASGTSLEAALDSPDLDEDMADQLYGVKAAWQDLQRATTLSEAWTEVIQPEFRNLKEVLPQATTEVSSLEQALSQLTESYQLLTRAYEDHDLEAVHNIMMASGLGPIRESLASRTSIANQQELQQSSSRLFASSEAGNEKVQAVLNSEATASAESLDQLVQTVGPMIADGATLTDVITNLRGQVPDAVGKSWRTKQQAVEEIVAFGRAGDSQLNELQAELAGALADLEDFMAAVQHGNFGEQEALAREFGGKVFALNSSRVQPLLQTLRSATLLAEAA